MYELAPQLQVLEFKSTDIYHRHKTCSVQPWKTKKGKKSKENGMILVFAEHLFSSVQVIQLVDAIPNLKMVHGAYQQFSGGDCTYDARHYCYDKGIEFEYVPAKV
jgi:hypothetical protein